jgi:hypothetical protein
VVPAAEQQGVGHAGFVVLLLVAGTSVASTAAIGDAGSGCCGHGLHLPW